MRTKRIKINIHLHYATIFYTVGALLIVFFMFLPSILGWDMSDLAVVIFFYTFLAVLFLLCIFFALYFKQTGILNEDSMIINCLIYKIIEIRWEDIIKIEILDLPTLFSTFRSFNKEWIVIYTDTNQMANKGGRNYRKKGPWYIKATKQNIKHIQEYCNKYSNIHF